ncbi:phenazine biosynthesis protein PhzF family [Xenococcus sp. PCC 7305]|uniref:PhzF family phenazine biosynthesis protein n=1 Tax=Xenococcus sp. PCC 7305 TaxID=102125 RepID=UPI0002AC9902|nr:PhzF family phenazine biosynthesis protein [Xenococcus sp. PCC 7305]ELS01810.1 phenazine biosynthesis protein PhzF family [Xenococcus sp. PCC 7305]
MNQKIIQVDAFTNTPFKGNPAAVCVLEKPQSAEWMQLIAREMNLSETAFILKQESGFNLRWFTPTTEVPLCGHATLASAHTLWAEGYLQPEEIANFQTKSGLLKARLQGDWIELDFPANFSEVTTPPPELVTALGANIITTVKNSLGYLVEVESASIVSNLQPNFSLLKSLAMPDVIVTSIGETDSEYDFVSRFFAPGLGIDEDPVTGAAHCCLAPFWHSKLQKNEFTAYQASARGGVVKVKYDGGARVFLQGQAVTVMKGELWD